MYEELLDAVIGNDVERVRGALKDGTAADPQEAGTTSALYRAAVSGRAEIVKVLLDHGADANRLSDGGDDEGLPLCAAAAWGHPEVIDLLLAAGAEPDARETGGWTALLWAATNGYGDCAEALLTAGADPDGAKEQGDTALTLAARRGALGVVRALLAHGADASLPDGDGDTALSIAEDWLGVHLESALLEQFEGEMPEGTRYAVARAYAADGTELVSVTALGEDGSPGAEIQAQRGHAAVATLLESAEDTYVAAEDMVRRAVAHRDADEDHETWWVVAEALGARADEETLEAALRLCTAEDPREREFGADVLGRLAEAEDAPDDVRERAVPQLRRMATTEGTEAVLDSVLAALGRLRDRSALPEVLDVIGRPGRTPTPADPVTLAAVLPPDHEEGVALLIAMTEDPDAEVRDWATLGVAGLERNDELVTGALLARLDDPSLTTVAEAVRGLADRGDARAEAGVRRVLAESDDEYARDLATEAAKKLGVTP
ncbi:ankyrin repeat domain-containing protein [Streptosporangium soli]|nr:ankyrin repeat domain-containing protein [Streptosporangium sp. KLBMP 9127]